MNDQPAEPGGGSREARGTAPGASKSAPQWVLVAGAVALAAVLVFAVWRLAVRSRPAPLVQADGERAMLDALAKGHYNVVLQVRARDSAGGLAAVGTTLPGRLTLKFVDAKGQGYLENFDRVGMWAVEMPPGTYWIPPDQDKLGEWKWKLAGDSLVRDGAKGWKFTLAAGTVSPMIDLLLE